MTMLQASLRFLARLLPVAGVAALGAGFVVARTWGDEAFAAFAWGAALSTTVCYLGFLLTIWAIPRSPNAQLASVVFGFLGRMITLTAAIFFLSRFAGLKVEPLGLSIIGFYFICMALEMVFLYRSGLLWKPSSSAAPAPAPATSRG